MFKFLLFKKNVNTENNEFQRFILHYSETLTIDAEGWVFVTKNLKSAIFYTAKEDFLHFIEILIDKELNEEARMLINDYIDFYGTEGLKYQLRIHIYCQKNGFCKQDAAFDTSILDSLDKNRVLLDCLKNQQIAIVGNGPSELGTRNGPAIDQNKYVIRFNNYKTAGFEEDYGTRTDIWVCANFDGLENRTEAELAGFKLIILEPDFNRDIIRGPAYETFANILTKHSGKVLSLKWEPKRRLVNALNTYPSTGLIIIDLLLNYTKVSVDNIFGFSFKEELEKRSGECDHYYEQRTDHKSRHNLVKESDYIRSVFSQSPDTR
jgi:hypothetical protein